ncbi:hypothetical protein GCM10009123_18120 [Kangiella japonica]|uniref:PDZ domain-containing protein n=1 Tax=Kangiella japonica TaxID=647384 RepID=A0ABN0T3M0_9GAMM
MKKSFLLFVFISLHVLNAQASELSNPKSQALLADIRMDINDSLSRVMDIERSDWTVLLRKPEDSYISLGIILEPSSKTVLSVSSHGLGSTLDLKVGDILYSMSINGTSYKNNLQELKASGGDKVTALVKRGDKEIELDTIIRHEVTPHWQLFASPHNSFLDAENNQIKTQQLQSAASISILKKLQGRINSMLSDIQRLEAESDNPDFHLDLSQRTKHETRFGVTIDRTTSQVIRVDEGSNADSLKLQPGDLIKNIKVNGKSVKNVSQLTLIDGDNLDVSVERDGQLISLTTQAKSNALPAWRFLVERDPEYPDSACGVVTLLLTPRISEDIYNVEASQLDGDNIISSKVIFKLKAGSHSFKLYDKIPSDKVVSDFRKRRSYKIGKTFVVNVEPNKRYYLASKFDRTKRWKTRNGEYWEPMVWKVEDYECSLD